MLRSELLKPSIVTRPVVAPVYMQLASVCQVSRVSPYSPPAKGSLAYPPNSVRDSLPFSRQTRPSRMREPITLPQSLITSIISIGIKLSTTTKTGNLYPSDLSQLIFSPYGSMNFSRAVPPRNFIAETTFSSTSLRVNHCTR